MTLSSPGQGLQPWAWLPAETAGLTANVVLASGQIDVEPWADNQEITIDRIVGNIHCSGNVTVQWDDIPPASYTPFIEFRLGILTQEEVDPTNVPFISLFSDENLEDFEWMYLRSFVPHIELTTAYAGTLAFGGVINETLDLDIGVRRKLGQTDNLLLYAQYQNVIDSNWASDPIVDVDGSHLLRSIFMSR